MSKKTNASVKAFKLLPPEAQSAIDMAVWDEIVDVLHEAGELKGRAMTDHKYEYIIDKNCPHLAQFKVPVMKKMDYSIQSWQHDSTIAHPSYSDTIQYEVVMVPCVKKDGHLDHHEGWFKDVQTGEDKVWAWPNDALPLPQGTQFYITDKTQKEI